MFRIYIDETDTWQRAPLYMAILTLLHDQGIAGATVLRGIAGYGTHGRIHTARLIEVASTLPVVIEVVDSRERLHALLPQLRAMVREGLITEHEIQVL